MDNDAAGQQCRDRNPDLEYALPTLKDWNDDLQAGNKLSYARQISDGVAVSTDRKSNKFKQA